MEQTATQLTRHFDQAGLPLELLRGPEINSWAPDIFQMDIRARRRKETFRVWPGFGENVVQVLNIDRRFRQLTLFVKEARRRFEMRVHLNEPLQPEDKILSMEGPHRTIWRWTPEEKRRYLCGFDERNLFIAQYAEGKTVRDAHRSLKAEASRAARAKVIRQGEWFFLAPTDSERERLDRYVRKNGFLRIEPVGSGRTPHVADALVRIPVMRGQPARTYARGRVQHDDHKTVKLPDWRRVERNREVLEASSRIGWID